MKHIFLLSALLLGWNLSGLGQVVDYDYVDGKVFVKHQGALQGEKWAELEQKYRIHSVRHPFRTPEVQDVAAVYFSEMFRVEDLIRELEQWPHVVYAEKVPLYRTAHIPNDTTGEQYAIGRIDLPEAWNITRGADSIVIAIIDDGFMLDHEDLIDKVWHRPGEIPGDSIDNDGNGFIDDVIGYDVADRDNDPGMVPGAGWGMAHGTHVAGIAVAATNNGKGIASAGYNCSFLAIKAKADTSVGQNILQATAEGIDYAMTSGARIVNMSFAGNGASTTMQSLISTGYWQGMTWVAGAGNDNMNRSRFPASYTHVVSVGGTNSQDAKAGFSNWHNTVDVMAPGAGIWSCFAGGTDQYTYMTGTSMSCPMTAGVCGLILSVNPDLVYGEVEQYLKLGCENIDAQNPAYVGRIGSGRINAYRSVMAVPRRNAPVADFLLPSDTVCQNTPFVIEDLSREFPQHWQWDFGDGTQDTTQGDVKHIYMTAGTYTVQLVVTNNMGSDTLVGAQTIYVRPAPELVIDHMPGPNNTGDLLASGCESYLWTPADFLSCVNCPDPSYSFPLSSPGPGEYACLCTDAQGCTDEASVPILTDARGPQAPGAELYPPVPQPAQESVWLRADFPRTAPLRIDLVDGLGRELAVLYKGMASPAFQLRVELPGGLAAGLYWLRWETDDRVQGQRLLIQ